MDLSQTTCFEHEDFEILGYDTDIHPENDTQAMLVRIKTLHMAQMLFDPHRCDSAQVAAYIGNVVSVRFEEMATLEENCKRSYHFYCIAKMMDDKLHTDPRKYLRCAAS